jgi:hypothetical protein
MYIMLGVVENYPDFPQQGEGWEAAVHRVLKWEIINNKMPNYSNED